jgi:polyferredoxin
LILAIEKMPIFEMRLFKHEIFFLPQRFPSFFPNIVKLNHSFNPFSIWKLDIGLFFGFPFCC